MFLRAFLNNAFVTHASGAWLDLKATDYSKKRKKAQKAQGLVTVSRTDAEGDAVKIEKGHVFKTKKDINGRGAPLLRPRGDGSPTGSPSG